MSSKSPSSQDSPGKEPRDSGPAWRGGKSAAPKAQSSASWKPDARQSGSGNSGRNMARWLVTLLALGLVAIFVYYLFLPDPMPLVMVRARQYPLRLPPLAFSQEDEAFISSTTAGNVRTSSPPRGLESRSSLDEVREMLSAIRPSLRSKLNPLRWSGNVEAAIVYVAAHGVVSDSGQPCLIPSGGDPFDESTWLPLADLLAEVHQVKARRKLIVLDCQRFLSSWRSGIFDNRFADALSGALAQAPKDSELLVLAAASPGQIAWTAPGRRGSVFGHFFARGLAGDADEDRSGDVSLAELAGYLSREVDGYSRQVWGTGQRPLVLGPQGQELATGGKGLVDKSGGRERSVDFRLARCGHGGEQENWWQEFQPEFDPIDAAKKLSGAGQSGEGPTLADLLALAEELRGPKDAKWPAFAHHACVRDPLQWARFQQQLAGIVERVVAGQEYQATLAGEIAALHGAMTAKPEEPWDRAPALNLVFAPPVETASPTRSTPPGEASFQAFRSWLDDKRPERPPTFSFGSRSRSQGIEDVYRQFIAPRPDSRQLDRASGISGQTLELARDYLDRQRQAMLSQGIVKGEFARDAELIEGHFVELLAKGLSGAGLSMNAVADAMIARRYAEMAATPADERAHYAVLAPTNAADATRRQAEDLLYAGKVSEPGQAEALFAAAVGDGSGDAGGYRASGALGEEVSAAFVLRDEVWAELPLLAEWYFLRWRLGTLDGAFTDGDEPLKTNAVALTDLIANNIALAAALEGPIDPAAVQAARQKVEQSFRRLRALPAPDLVAGSDDEVRFRDATTLRHHWLLAQGLLLDDPTRVNAFGKCIETLADPSAMTQQQRPAGELSQDAALSAHQAFVDTLKSSLTYGFTDDDFPDHVRRQAALAQSGKKPPSVWQSALAWWTEYDKRRQTSLTEAFGTAAAQRAERAGRSVWDRRFRAIATWICQIDQPPPQATQGGGNTAAPVRRQGRTALPADQLRRFDVAHLLAWHAYRLREDFWGNGVVVEDRAPLPFFAAKIDHCASCLPADYRRMQYADPGTGGLVVNSLARPARPQDVEVEGEADAALAIGAAADAGLPLTISVRSDASGTGRTPLPAGSAALLGDPPVEVAFLDESGRPDGARGLVPISSGAAPAASDHRALLKPAGGDPPDRMTASLWYRGHVWRSEPFPVSPGPNNYLALTHERVRYSPPSITVRGDPRPVGAILFVFDCSASMQSQAGQDGGTTFDKAHTMLKRVVDGLGGDANPQLWSGLMLYGHRTPVASDRQLYLDRPFDVDDNLKPQGQRLLAGDPRFRQRFPHPDRDIESVVPLEKNGQESVLAALDTVTLAQCVGTTPLYASITEAIEKGFDNLPDEVTSRQVIVLTDGVNFPYFQGLRPARRGEEAMSQPEYDRRLLERSLARHKDVAVSVFYFGKPTGEDLDRFSTLKNLADNGSYQFDVVQTDDIAVIESSIQEVLPRPKVTLTGDAVAGSNESVELKFNDIWKHPDWDSQNLLLNSPQSSTVGVTLPFLMRPFTRTVELVGGEAVVLEFDAERKELALDTSTSVGGGVPLTAQDPASVPRNLLVERLKTEKVGSRAQYLSLQFISRKPAEELAPRPARIWAKVTPLDAETGTQPQSYAVIDAHWVDQQPLPLLRLPVPPQWALGRQFQVELAVRYDAPPQIVPLKAGEQQRELTVDLPGTAPAKWVVQQRGGEAGTDRTIVVTHTLDTPDPTLAALFDCGLWLSPAPDATTRSYARDGSHAIHQFTYRRREASRGDLELGIDSKARFEQGAYTAELEITVQP